MSKVTSFQDDIMGQHDACALSALLAKGDISPLELTQTAIKRAESVNPQLNAIATKAFERATERAMQPFEGMFAGIPTFIKDSDPVKGLPYFLGSELMPEKPAKVSSETVLQIEALGINILGITTIPELGLTLTTESTRFGATRNPWHTDYSTGGSSGGASALVAAGVIPFAHANDGGGSIRIPASCCGLVGLKPTQGRVKTVELPSFFPMNHIHQGIVSRTVRDTARFYEGIEQHFRAPGIPLIGHVDGLSSKRLKIAVFVEDLFGVHCDSQCVRATMQAATLCEELGHEVEVIGFPYPKHLWEDFFILWEVIPFFLWFFGKQLVDPDVQPRKMGTLGRYLKDQFKKDWLSAPFAFRRLKRFARQYDALMGEYDIFLSPTLGTPPPKLGYLGPEVDTERHLQRVLRAACYTYQQNISGTPAISLPLGKSTEGLPIGIQFAAKHGQDRMLLELAFELEQAAPWEYPLPPTGNT